MTRGRPARATVGSGSGQPADIPPALQRGLVGGGWWPGSLYFPGIQCGPHTLASLTLPQGCHFHSTSALELGAHDLAVGSSPLSQTEDQAYGLLSLLPVYLLTLTGT